MRIVDSQIHLWQASRPDRPWPTVGVPPRHGPETVSAESALAQMDAAGVAAALLVPPSFEGDRNDVVLDAARRHPGRFKVLGRFTLDAPDAPEQVATALDDRDMLGLRVTINGGSEHWLRERTIDWLWRMLAERERPVSLFVPNQVEAVERVAREFPTLRVSIDHLGLYPTARDEAILPVIDALCHLARHENVAVKASALPIYTTEAYPFESLQRVLRRVVGEFGPSRVFWGSDLTRLRCDYREAVDYALRGLAPLGTAAVADVMGGSLARWFGWHDFDLDRGAR